MDPPLPIHWQALDLAVKTDDGVVVRSIEERLKALWPVPSGDARPFVVWVSGPVGDGIDAQIAPRVFQDRLVTIILRMFRCLKVNVPDLPDSEVKRMYAAAPGFRFYDPAAREAGAALVGKRRLSRTRFLEREQNAWEASFETTFKAWAKPMLRIYRTFDDLDGQEKVVRLELGNPSTKPDPEKRKTLEAEIARIAKEREEARAEEAKVTAACRLRPEFLPPPAEKEASKLR